MSRDVVIVSACRTAIGRFMGGLSGIAAPQLGATCVREAIKRAGIAPDAVEEVILGNVLQGGVSLRAVGFGMGDRVPGLVKARGDCDVAYSVELNDWQGRQSIELHLKDIRPSEGA